MNKLISAILISCFAFNASAGLCDVPEKVAKGVAAPCSGYIFSEKLEERVRTDLVYKDSLIKNLTEASDAQAEIIRMSNEQLDLYQQELRKQKTMNILDKALYFGLGVLVTYGATKIVR